MWAFVFPKSKVVFIAFWEHTEISKIIQDSGRKWKSTYEKIFLSWNAGPLLIHPIRMLIDLPTLCVQHPWMPFPEKCPSQTFCWCLEHFLPEACCPCQQRCMENCHLPVNQEFFNYGRLLCPFSVFCWCHCWYHLIYSLTADHIFPSTTVCAALGSVSR